MSLTSRFVSPVPPPLGKSLNALSSDNRLGIDFFKKENFHLPLKNSPMDLSNANPIVYQTTHSDSLDYDLDDSISDPIIALEIFELIRNIQVIS